MAHQETPEAGGDGNPADANPATPFEDIAKEMLGEDVVEEEEEPAEGELADEAEDEPELEAEADDLPPIEAPVSLSAEDKEAFKSWPRDAQELFTKRLGEVEKGLHSKAQEAARARQEVEQAAHQRLAQYDRQVAEQLAQYAQAITPQRPNPALLQHDPQAFYQLQAEYEAGVAQQHQLQQQAQEYAQQAQYREQVAAQHEAQREHQIIAEQFPEYLDPTSGAKLQQELSAVARELGYPPELIQQARATDILAMRKVAELKAKADKYDLAMKKQMERVRQGKGKLPPVSTPGVSKGAEGSRKSRAEAAWETVKSAKSRNVRDDAAATWLENSGWL